MQHYCHHIINKSCSPAEYHIEETATTIIRARAQHLGHYLDKTQALGCRSCKLYRSIQKSDLFGLNQHRNTEELVRSCLSLGGRTNIEFRRLACCLSISLPSSSFVPSILLEQNLVRRWLGYKLFRVPRGKGLLGNSLVCYDKSLPVVFNNT